MGLNGIAIYLHAPLKDYLRIWRRPQTCVTSQHIYKTILFF